MPGKHWTTREENTLAELIEAGVCNSDIATILGRSPQAISNKKIGLRDPSYYAEARAKAEVDEAIKINEEMSVKGFDWEAAGIIVIGLTVFSIFALGAAVTKVVI